MNYSGYKDGFSLVSLRLKVLIFNVPILSAEVRKREQSHIVLCRE